MCLDTCYHLTVKRIIACCQLTVLEDVVDLIVYIYVCLDTCLIQHHECNYVFICSVLDLCCRICGVCLLYGVVYRKEYFSIS